VNTLASSTKKVSKKQEVVVVEKEQKNLKKAKNQAEQLPLEQGKMLNQEQLKVVDMPVPDVHQILGGNLIFAEQSSEEEVFHQDELIQLFPFGVSITPDILNPFVLLKDKSLDLTLPVAIHPIEASSVLSFGNKTQVPYNPHAFLKQILSSLDIKVLQCVFVQLKGPKQFVRIYFQGHDKLNSIKVQADQAISLCISMDVPIFATKKIINQSKLLNVQIEGVTKRLIENQKTIVRNSSYIQ
jgi:bifunctional DNase/RNase